MTLHPKRLLANISALVLSTPLVLVLDTNPAIAARPPHDSSAIAADDNVSITARRIKKPATATPRSGSRRADAPPTTVVRTPACGRNGPEGSFGDDFCGASRANCPPGQTFSTTWTRTGDAAQWVNQGTRCTTEAADAAPVVLPTVTVSDLRRVGLPASPVHLQPDDGQALLNVPLVLRTTGGTVVRDTTVLGFPVRIRATPASWTWDLGDGTRLGPTDDPGRTYPRQTLTHTYTTPGDRTVTLTTTWSGEYSIAGLPYRPVEGTATTVSPGVGVRVLAGRNVLTAPDG
ncbi:PKD domain-containing protein [Kineococcus sp. DHX-1]|uniref:PKD domain-containing protein n=1 Tax=Kineococcus sp. DHX-1 TaxID=3349638 RepID=UPI0036D3D99C